MLLRRGAVFYKNEKSIRKLYHILLKLTLFESGFKIENFYLQKTFK